MAPGTCTGHWEPWEPCDQQCVSRRTFVVEHGVDPHANEHGDNPHAILPVRCRRAWAPGRVMTPSPLPSSPLRSIPCPLLCCPPIRLFSSLPRVRPRSDFRGRNEKTTNYAAKCRCCRESRRGGRWVQRTEETVRVAVTGRRFRTGTLDRKTLPLRSGIVLCALCCTYAVAFRRSELSRTPHRSPSRNAARPACRTTGRRTCTSARGARRAAATSLPGPCQTPHPNPREQGAGEGSARGHSTVRRVLKDILGTLHSLIRSPRGLATMFRPPLPARST